MRMIESSYMQIDKPNFANQLAKNVDSVIYQGGVNIHLKCPEAPWNKSSFVVVGEADHDRVISVRTRSYGYDDDRVYHVCLVAIPCEVSPQTPFGWDFKEMIGYGSVDASEELLSIYQQTVKRRGRVNEVQSKRARQNRFIENAKKAMVSLSHAFELRRIYGHDETMNVLFPLLKSYNTRKLRSHFRISMGEQLMSWLNSTNRRYNKPLSPKQFDAIRPMRRFY